jgi:hypothetical protein
MAEPAPRRVPTATTDPVSPGDPKLQAVLAIIWKHGLFPSLVAFAFAYLLYSLAVSFTNKLEAIDVNLDSLDRKIEAHQAAMDRMTLERATVDRAQSSRLKGICYGVTDENSRARALCDVD